MSTDTSEKGLEGLVVAAMTGLREAPTREGSVSKPPVPYGGTGWLYGHAEDYDREHCVDRFQLRAFLSATQPKVAEALDLRQDSPTRRKFLARLQGEISKRGTIDVLRHAVRHGPHHLDLFYGTPSPGNDRAQALYTANRFSVTRQLRYSRDETQLALDLGLFINGLPVATFELKNSLTKQTVEDAIQQYRRDRDPREKLFELGRCVVHFAVDDHEVRFCTHLQGKGSWFLPFKLGWNDGAGNPPNPNGLKTDYLWKRILTREGLTDILENYAQVVVTKDEKTGRKKAVQIWPRLHQLDVVRKLLGDAAQHGAGRRYLIQHSAGSGKSNSIAWLAHQLIGLARRATTRVAPTSLASDAVPSSVGAPLVVAHGDGAPVFDSIIVVTDRKILDEAHSSQGGRTSAALSMVLSTAGAEDDDETTEDKVNRLMEAKKLLPNASYFAFTATPKNKTLEIFGEALPSDAEGKVRHRPFHSYTMKQAIQEGFILDVLKHYTPVESYYKLIPRAYGRPPRPGTSVGVKVSER